MATEDERMKLAEVLAGFQTNPLGYVRFAYPWGEPGGLLQREPGPDDWQEALLEDIGEALTDQLHGVHRFAVASGHGIGKSTMMAWLVDWVETCWPLARGTVTANTDGQLRNKTWAEVSKWFHMKAQALKDPFKLTATAVYAAEEAFVKSWRIDAVPWSKTNPAAFAGLHNAGNIILILMDEASEIDDVIWEVLEGATTDADTTILWIAFGNPTRNTGRFKEVMVGNMRHLWNSRRIDSRTVKRTNKALLETWREAYGDDSDFMRVRVEGKFPRAGTMQFIPEDIVDAAHTSTFGFTASDALVWGLDVARHGADSTVLCQRRGRDARSLPWKIWNVPNLMTVAADVAALYSALSASARPDAIFVDVTGMGWGLYDRLTQLLPEAPIYEANFGSAGGMAEFNGIQADTALLVDRIWVGMREWLRSGGMIPPNTPGDVIGPRLHQDLIGREYGYNAKNQIRMETKDHMKARGLASPDYADALALTFTLPVMPRLGPLGQIGRSALQQAGGPYDPLRDLR